MKKTSTIYHLAAAIALVTATVYLPALHNEFVNWDDGQYVFDNTDIRSLDSAFFRWAFLGFHAGNWHPLTWISHSLDYVFWGLNPTGHHLTSVILHAINSALVFLLALKLLSAAMDGSKPNAARSFLNRRTIPVAAIVTGVLFGLHPVHVESVAWVAERKDVLCGLFFLLAMIRYIEYAGGEDNKTHRAESLGQRENAKTPALAFRLPFTDRRYLAALILFVLALLSKPMAVTLPVVLLILDWYPLNRVRSVKTFMAACVEKIPFAVLSGVSSVITFVAQKTGGSLSTVEQITVPERMLVALNSLVAYLGKIVLPVNLLPLYPYPEIVRLFSFTYLSAIVLVAGITAVCAGLARKERFWLAAWGYYVVTLIPVLGIVQVGVQAMADRYTYLPSLAPFLTAGIGAAWIQERLPVKLKNMSVKPLLAAAASAVLVLFTSITLKQITIWHDDISLWDQTIKNNAHVPQAYEYRGTAFAEKGMIDQAIQDLEIAIKLDPDRYDAYINLGTAFQKSGRWEKAKENIEKAIRVNPSSHEAYIYRAVLYEETGQLDKALDDYTKAITLKPSYAEAYNSRGVIFAEMNRLDEAIADYSETIKKNPRHIDAYSNRGAAYTLKGRYDKALDDFNIAVSLGPDNPMTHLNRGLYFRRAGRIESAYSDFHRACYLGNQRACSELRQLSRR